MARLTPEELQAARRRSGRLGGRPRKPTTEEARQAALEKLVPKSLKVLTEHLESGRPDSWRPALRILEHAWGRPKETVEVQEDLSERPLDELTQAELYERLRQYLAEQSNGTCRRLP
jgi:hypothetical protein